VLIGFGGDVIHVHAHRRGILVIERFQRLDETPGLFRRRQSTDLVGKSQADYSSSYLFFSNLEFRLLLKIHGVHIIITGFRFAE
jgi:hypothetical protein